MQFCQDSGIQPRRIYNPMLRDMTDPAQHPLYFITLEECEQWIAAYCAAHGQEDPRQIQLPIDAIAESDLPPSGATAPRAALSTGDVAAAFAGLHDWDEAAWKKNLQQAGAQWLRSLRLSPGLPGRREGGARVEAQWDVLGIGSALIAKGVAVRTVRSRFQTHHLLNAHLSAWREHEAENHPERGE